MDRFRVESAPVIPLSMKNVFDGANHLGISVQFAPGLGDIRQPGQAIRSPQKHAWWARELAGSSLTPPHQLPSKPYFMPPSR